VRIIAGEARGRLIEAPAGLHTRPTLDRVRENMFNIIQAFIPGSRILDLFSGSGALSLEALSRGAEYAVMVDSDRNAHEVQKKNIEKLRYSERARLYNCDWRKAVSELQKNHDAFDVVFLDPPYAMSDLQEVFSSLHSLIQHDSLVVLEHESGKEIQVPGNYELIKQRSWGFCAVSLYRPKE